LYRPYIAAQLVRHDDTRFTELLDQSGKKALGGLGVAASLNQNVEYVTIGVNGPPEPEFLSADRDDGLIHMPLIVRPGPVSANAVGIMSANAVDPETNCFPAQDNTAFSKKVFDIGRAQSQPMLGPDRAGDNFTRKTQSLQTGKSARQSLVVSIIETSGSKAG
jgi:hypothetical protein